MAALTTVAIVAHRRLTWSLAREARTGALVLRRLGGAERALASPEVRGLGDCRAMAGRGGSVIEHAPALVLRSGEVVRLKLRKRDDDTYPRAVAAAEAIAKELEVALHPPRRGMTLVT